MSHRAGKEVAISGSETSVGALTPSNKIEYRAIQWIREKCGSISCIAFNEMDDQETYFALAGRNQVSCYKVDTSRENVLTLSDPTYFDEDRDSFNAVSWASGLGILPLVVAGGLHGKLQVLEYDNFSATLNFYKNLQGHQGAVNEIRQNTFGFALVLSASKDESVRLWNIHTGVCVLIFSGANGHHGEVYSVHSNPMDETSIISSGADKTIKIWSFKGHEDFVIDSGKWVGETSKFQTKVINSPIHEISLCELEAEYVGCNRFSHGYDNMIFSQIDDYGIVMWQMQSNGESNIVKKLPVPESGPPCKFSYDFGDKIAIGNKKGKIYVWNFKSNPPELIAILSHPKSTIPITQTAMSGDGRTIYSVNEKGVVIRWNEKTSEEEVIRMISHRCDDTMSITRKS